MSATEPDTRAAINVSQIPAVKVCEDSDDIFRQELVVSMDELQTHAVQDCDDFDVNSREALVVSAMSSDSDTNERFLVTFIVPDCMTISVLSSSGDCDVCQPDTGRVGVTNCLGICGFSDDISYLLCARCIDILLWGFRVSCVISVMITWTLIKTREFFKRLDVFDGVWGWTNILITLGDDVFRSLRRTKAYVVISPYVMMRRGTMITGYGFPWRGDNGRSRACCASLDLYPIRIGGRFGWVCYTVLSADWMDVQPVDGGLVRMKLWIGYKGDGHSQDGSSDEFYSSSLIV